MGYDLNRFQGEVDEELTCPICSGVLEEPLQAAMCEHAFCRACITEWLTRQPTCPVDRNNLTTANLRAVPRILRNLLSRLSITCDNAAHGCGLVLKLDALNTHLDECEFNPKRPLPCENGCGFVIPKDELKDHNCVRELRTLIHTQQLKLTELKTEITDQNLTINELKRELQLFKDFMRAMRVSNPAMRAIADQMERDEVIRWSSTLARARVTRWGGMISTPDDALQMMIKRALSESGCPPHILDDLMENCHERRWPRGLSSLETRQNNRRIYDNYICRRIPGKQAVLVLSCDNAHMCEDVMIEPGLVMIFAHDKPGDPFDEITVESSLNIRKKVNPVRRTRNIAAETFGLRELVRTKRQGRRNRPFGTQSSSAQAAANSNFFNRQGFGASAANSQAQGFQSQGPLGGFGASATNAQTQSFTAGRNGLQGSAGLSGSQVYNLPNGQSINLAYSNGFSVGPDGRPAVSQGNSLTFNNGRN